MPAKKTTAKNIDLVLLHGLAGWGDNVWFPWLRERAAKQGFNVWSPSLPNPLKPELSDWLKFIRTQAEQWGPNTIVIGHSLGGVLTLRLLEQCCQQKIRGVILVSSPFASTMPFEWLNDFFDQPIAWEKLRAAADRYVVIQAKNDPIVPFDHALRYQEALAATMFMTEKDGHFISRTAPLVWEELSKL